MTRCVCLCVCDNHSFVMTPFKVVALALLGAVCMVCAAYATRPVVRVDAAPFVSFGHLARLLTTTRAPAPPFPLSLHHRGQPIASFLLVEVRGRALGPWEDPAILGMCAVVVVAIVAIVTRSS